MNIEKIASGWIGTETPFTYHGWPTLCKLPSGDLLAVAFFALTSPVALEFSIYPPYVSPINPPAWVSFFVDVL